MTFSPRRLSPVIACGGNRYVYSPCLCLSPHQDSMPPAFPFFYGLRVAPKGSGNGRNQPHTDTATGLERKIAPCTYTRLTSRREKAPPMVTGVITLSKPAMSFHTQKVPPAATALCHKKTLARLQKERSPQ